MDDEIAGLGIRLCSPVISLRATWIYGAMRRGVVIAEPVPGAVAGVDCPGPGAMDVVWSEPAGSVSREVGLADLALDLEDPTGIMHAVWYVLEELGESVILPPGTRAALDRVRAKPHEVSEADRAHVRAAMVRASRTGGGAE